MYYVILIIILFSQASFLVGDASSIFSMDDLSKYLGENYPEKEKLDAIGKFQFSGYKLTEEDIKKINDFLPKMDKNIISPFLQLIMYLNHLSNGKDICIPDDTCTKILDKCLHDPPRFREIFSILMSNFKGKKPPEDFFKTMYSELEHYLKKSDILLSYYLTDEPKALDQCCYYAPDSYRFIYQKLKESDDSLKSKILKFILSGELKYSLDIENLKILAELTESKNSEVRDLSKNILTTATWQKDIGNWGQWLQNHDQNDILQGLLAKLKDEKTDMSEKYLLAKQFRVDVNVTTFANNDELFVEAMNIFMGIAKSRNEDFELRVLCLKDAVIFHYHTDDTIKKTTDLIKEFTRHLVVKEDDKRFYPFLLIGDKHILDDPGLRKKLMQDLNDDKIDIKTTAFMALALGQNSIQKKQIASAILKQCKKGKIFDDPSFNETQAKSFFRSSLKELTGKDCSDDYDAWKKVISAMPGQ